MGWGEGETGTLTERACPPRPVSDPWSHHTGGLEGAPDAPTASSQAPAGIRLRFFTCPGSLLSSTPIHFSLAIHITTSPGPYVMPLL